MSKSRSFTLVLTVICLSVLMSLEADAQSTTDETNSCSSQEEVVNLVKINALKLEENARKIDKMASKSCESDKVEPSKQALVSALTSECLILYGVLIKTTKIGALKITKRTV